MNHYKQRIYGNALNMSEKETYYNTSDSQYDYVYYNIELNNFPKIDPINNNIVKEEDIPISIKINRVSNILLDDTKDWEIGVQSYSIPNTLPIITSKTVEIKDDGEDYLGDPLYYVIIKDNNTNEEYKAYLDFEGLNQDPDIYEYSEIVRVMNSTIKFIIDEFNLANGIPPFFKINKDGKYEYWSPPDFTDPNPNFKLKMSYSCYKLFSCFEYSTFEDDFIIFGTPNTGHELEEYDGVDYFVQYEQWDPRPGCSSYRRIIFKTTIPLINELTGDVQQTSETILIDRLVTDRIANTCTSLNYDPLSNVIYHNMLSSQNFRQFTVQVFSEQKNGIVEPFQLNSGDSFFLKIVFRRPKK